MSELEKYANEIKEAVDACLKMHWEKQNELLYKLALVQKSNNGTSFAGDKMKHPKEPGSFFGLGNIQERPITLSNLQISTIFWFISWIIIALVIFWELSVIIFIQNGR